MNENRNAHHERPIGVWLISVFGILLVGWIVLVQILAFTGVVKAPPGFEMTLSEWLSKVPTVFFILIGLLIVIAAITLFLLRQSAYGLFLSALGIDVFVTTLSMTWRTPAEEFWGPGSVLKLIWHAYLIVTCIYAWRLRKKGILH